MNVVQIRRPAFLIALYLLCVPLQSMAASSCDSSPGEKITVAVGILERYRCRDDRGPRTRFVLNGRFVLVDAPGTVTLAQDNSGRPNYKNATLAVLQGQRSSYKERACPDCLYLLDLNFESPHVYGFGVKNAENEFHWASWGKRRSVIAIKKNVKFIYEGGKLIPPKKDNDLFLTIKPTMFETPVEKLEPFVQQLPVRKMN